MIVYLHGFASAGVGPKVDVLKARFGDENVIAPSLPFDPAEVHTLIFDIVEKVLKSWKPGDKLIFVGTSLGAFYANYFGHVYDCPVVLVNPSVRPNKTLAEKLGSNKNYVTGDEFFVSVAHLDKLEEMSKYVFENYSGSLVNMFLAKDDDVIPYEVPLAAYPYTSYKLITEDGGHRFTEHWDKVLDRVEELLK